MLSSIAYTVASSFFFCRVLPPPLRSSRRIIPTPDLEKVAQVALGPLGGHAVTALLAALTIFVIIAYMVLVRDLWSGVVEALIGRALDGRGRTQVFAKELKRDQDICSVSVVVGYITSSYVGSPLG